MRFYKYLFFLTMLCIFSACSVEPETIDFGNDHCVYCKMTISDPKYGAELVTDKGRVYKFDAIECMIPYMEENPDNEFSHVMAIAFDEPKSLKNVAHLYFVQNEHFKSPMGKNLAAFTSQPEEFNTINWEQLKTGF
jgi:copper chaperone NosL